jgi:hypothetical protein
LSTGISRQLNLLSRTVTKPQERKRIMMELAKEIKASIMAYDRRSPLVLSEAEAHFRSCKRYPDALISIVDSQDQSVSSGATWMIKSLLKQGQSLSPNQCKALVDRLPNITEWDAQLHVCQLIRYLETSDRNVDSLVDWLQPLLKHRRPFIRAWSLDALCHIAKQHSAYGSLH